MELADKVVVVTGGARGIGRAMCERFAAEGARGVVVADLDADAAGETAAAVGGVAVRTDVAVEDDVTALVAAAEDAYGPIDLFCSNAGITGPRGGADVSDEDWHQIWHINVMAHVYAARAVVPGMLERGRGYLLQTASAAGLLTTIGSAPYSVTKHAAVALAEWLAITYGDEGLGVSCLCPQYVRTDMLDQALDQLGGGTDSGMAAFIDQTAIGVDAVVEAVVDGLAEERFLILPHPEVADYFRNKANDYDRWIAGMRRLQAAAGPPPS